jgi:hypothetical protein
LANLCKGLLHARGGDSLARLGHFYERAFERVALRRHARVVLFCARLRAQRALGIVEHPHLLFRARAAQRQDERGRVARGQVVLADRGERVWLLAARQDQELPRQGRLDEAEPEILPDLIAKPRHQRDPSRHPALALADHPGDLDLRAQILFAHRGHDEGLLPRIDRARAPVEEQHGGFGRAHVQVQHARPERRQLGNAARRVPTGEAVDDLVSIVRGWAHHDRRHLSVAAQRCLHRGDRLGPYKAERAVPLADLGGWHLDPLSGRAARIREHRHGLLPPTRQAHGMQRCWSSACHASKLPGLTLWSGTNLTYPSRVITLAIATPRASLGTRTKSTLTSCARCRIVLSLR